MNILDIFQPRTPDDYGAHDSYYWRARNEYLKLINQYASEHNSLKIGQAYTKAWFNELFPDGLISLTWEEVYNDLLCHREHPPRCDCNGINNPTGCPVCRVSARISYWQ